MQTSEKPLPKLWEIKEGGRLVINPHPGQARALASNRRFVMMIAGAQSGKSSLGPIWLFREIQRRGPGDYICCTPNHSLTEMAMLPRFREFFEDALELGEWRESKHHFLISSRGNQMLFGKDVPTTTRIIFGSAQSPGALEAATAKGAWCDELGQPEFGVGAWEAILRRVALYRGRIFGTTTPYSSTGWFKTRLYDRFVAGDPTIDVIQFRSTENPLFTQEEFEERRADMQEWKFKLFYEGDFARPAALIYDDFLKLPKERGGHLVKPFQIPWHWERFVGIDFGAVTTAIVWIARDERNDHFYVYRTKKLGRLPTGDYVAIVQRENGRDDITGYYGGSPGESQYRMDWDNAGIPVLEPPITDVESGIDKIVSLLRSYRIFFFDDLGDLFTEMESYTREVDDTGLPTEKIHDKNSFHLLDALRYGVVGAYNPKRLFVANPGIARLFGFSMRGPHIYE